MVSVASSGIETLCAAPVSNYNATFVECSVLVTRTRSEDRRPLVENQSETPLLCTHLRVIPLISMCRADIVPSGTFRNPGAATRSAFSPQHEGGPYPVPSGRDHRP